MLRVPGSLTLPPEALAAREVLVITMAFAVTMALIAVALFAAR
jgi:hypothetical protein